MGSTTRDDLHRIAAHVLGRRRYAVSGHFGLRASPRGVATPAFGPEPEVLRIAGSVLVREVGTQSRAMPLAGATLAELAAFGGADLDDAFSAGPDTPAVGPTDEPLRLSDRRARRAVRLVRPRVAGARRRHRGLAGRPVHGAAVAGALRRRLHPRPRVGRRREPGLLARRLVLRRALRVRRAVGPRAAGRCRVLERPFRRHRAPLRAGGYADCAAFIHRGLELLGQG